jgi:branched-chain amino acid transport system permease protein
MLEYLATVLTFVGIFGLAAMSFDLLLGYAGIISLAQASFVGLGAYSSALLTTRLGWGFLPSMLAGIVVATIFGMIIAVALLRLSGDYMMVGSVGFLFSIQAILVGWEDVTRGTVGVPGIPRAKIGSLVITGPFQYLAMVLAFCAIFYFLAWRLVKSPYGRTLQAMRDDEIATMAVGKNLLAIKVSVFIIAAAIAAVAGSLYAHFVRFVDPYHYSLHDTFALFCMVTLGGMATLKGPYLGALVLLGIPEIARFMGLPTGIMGHIQEIIYGLALILVARFRPQGLLGQTRPNVADITSKDMAQYGQSTS